MEHPTDTKRWQENCTDKGEEVVDVVAATSQSPTIDDSSLSVTTDTQRLLYNQLLYYFSQENLQKDVYLQTLRSLNDGCVPVTILANFAKIKSICNIRHHHNNTSSSMNSVVCNSNSSICNWSSSNTVLDVPVPTITTTNDTVIDTTAICCSKSNSSSRTKEEEQKMSVQEEEKRRIDTIVHVLLQHNSAVLSSSSSSSDYQLQLYSIDTQTGKRINTIHDVSFVPTTSTTTSHTIIAVGLRDGLVATTTTTASTLPTTASTQPVVNDQSLNEVEAKNDATTTVKYDSALAAPTTTATTNTLILRDVESCISAQEIYTLIQSVQDCPTITNIVPDIGNCWFITFDTSDRYDLIRVMMQLRMMTYPSNDEPVMVRLRASIIQPSNMIRVDSYNHQLMYQQVVETSSSMGNSEIIPLPIKKKRRKKKRPNKKRKNKPSTTSVATTNTSTTTTAPSDTSFTDSHGKRHSLDLTRDDDFPSLQRQYHHRVSSVGTSVEIVNDSINDDMVDDSDDDDDQSNSVSCSNTSNNDNACDQCYDYEGLVVEERDEPQNKNLDGEHDVSRLSSKLQGLQHSDTASTATTTSSNGSSNGSSTSSSNSNIVVMSTSSTSETTGSGTSIVLSGYAEAVRRTSSQPLQQHPQFVSSNSKTAALLVDSSILQGSVARTEQQESGETITSMDLPSSTKNAPPQPIGANDTTTTVIRDRSQWGIRRSFADVIRETSSNQ